MMAMDVEETRDPATGKGERSIGLVVAERLYAGMLVNGVLDGPVQQFPDGEATGFGEDESSLIEFHTDALIEAMCAITVQAANGEKKAITSVGVALPGLMRGGVVEEAPNLPQLKGARMAELLKSKLSEQGIDAPVVVSNDADATAAGLALSHGKLDRRYRVWTLGTGIGYGTYPLMEGVFEGGHTTVTLDDRENYCGCGGRGHLEGIMGQRAMRLRFLDMEPEEVFAAACRREQPDARCVEFRNLWHRALAAATATSIHVNGAGKFFFTGYNTRFLDLNLLRQFLHEMITMSSLQSYQLEIVPEEQRTRVTGAAVIAEQATAVVS